MTLSPVESAERSPAATEGHLLVTTRDGLTQRVSGQDGSSIMQLIRDAGIDELPAVCGGARSCATCHVQVAPEWIDQLPAMSDEEAVLLEALDNRTAHSRLSCQIPYGAELAGLSVTITPAE
jgi:2Fe-2S ferredoxin